MEENIASAKYEAQKEWIALWLSRLFLCQIVAIALSALAPISGIVETVLSWASRIVSVCSILVLFKLSAAHSGYRKSAIMRCVVLGGGILSLLMKSTLWASLWSILNLIALYQEYHAHADLSAEKAQTLSRRWVVLFHWQILGGVLTGIISVFLIIGGALSGIPTASLTAFTLWLVRALTIILGITYLILLHKTIHLYRS